MKKYKKSFKAKNKNSFLKTIKKVFINKFFWLGFFILIFFSSLLYLFIFSSVFRIKGFQILGCQKISVEEIESVIGSKKGSNIFLINFEEVTESLIKGYPQIAQINLKRKFPNSILVEIKERKPVVYKKEAQWYYLVDIEGVVFEKTKEVQDDIIEVKDFIQRNDIELGREYFKKDDIENILKIRKKLKSLDVAVVEAEIFSQKRLNIKTIQGFELYFSLEKSLDLQLEKLEVILKEKILPIFRKNIDYIDLRFEKIFVSPEKYDLQKPAEK